MQIKALRRPFPDYWITPQTAPTQPKTVGEHVKIRRIELRLLQRDVAKQIGVHMESVKNWERGVTSPLITHMPNIIEFLGYNPEVKPDLLSERIVHIRKQLGLTQEALAKALAIDPVTVWRWEKGQTTPPSACLSKLESLMAESRVTPR